MWIRSQDGTQILKVERFRSIALDNGDVNILAKLDRETVILGTYSNYQAEDLMRHLFWILDNKKDECFAMPVRWEDEEE